MAEVDEDINLNRGKKATKIGLSPGEFQAYQELLSLGGKGKTVIAPPDMSPQVLKDLRDEAHVIQYETKSGRPKKDRPVALLVGLDEVEMDPMINRKPPKAANKGGRPKGSTSTKPAPTGGRPKLAATPVEMNTLLAALDRETKKANEALTRELDKRIATLRKAVGSDTTPDEVLTKAIEELASANLEKRNLQPQVIKRAKDEIEASELPEKRFLPLLKLD